MNASFVRCHTLLEMNEIRMTGSAAERPYRSHKIRACDYCRRRKQRCIVKMMGQPCRLCEQQGISCCYTHGIGPPSSVTPKNPSSMAREQRHLTAPPKRIELSSIPLTNTSPGHNLPVDRFRDKETAADILLQSAHIVGPVVSEDAHVLERYMSPASPQGRRPTGNPFNVYSADPEMPVLYTKVERRRLGLGTSHEPGMKQKQIMDQILAANTRILIDTYLSKIHPCFPVIDQRKLARVISEDNNIYCSATLACEIYAITLCFWSHTDVAVRGPRPDQRFAWNLAVEALQEDFLAPGMSTLQAVLVDLTGRPIYSLTGNVINNGRAVALANSLGLNKNPKRWNISNDEKNLRIRVWWGVLIHDTWGCFAHGTPPSISPNYHDVPVPTLHDLTALKGQQVHKRAAQCFIALCRLTEILAKLLPLVYGLQVKVYKDIRKVVRAVETDLDLWEDDLPDYLREVSTNNEHISGSSSLHLGFLSLKMLVCRTSLHGVSNSRAEDNTTESVSYHQSECRRSALAIMKFVSSLKNLQLTDFWLPYGAYFLTSATTLLLRFAVQTTDDSVAASCLSSVKEFARHLKSVRDQYDWDLGSHCLAQCEGIVERMTHNGNSAGHLIEEQGSQNLAPFFDLGNPVDWLDSCLPISFGQMTEIGPARDLWDFVELDTLPSGNPDISTQGTSQCVSQGI